MTDEDQSGSEFRAKYEASIAETKALREAFAGTYKYVKADDLVGVAPDQFVAKAVEVEQARKAEREAIAKEFLAERGLPDADLDSVLQGLKQPPAADTDGGAAARVAQLGQLGGTAPTQQANQNLFGEDRIRAALGAE